MSERAAARYFGVSRESVKKMLAFSVPPGYRRTAPVRRPKLDGFTRALVRAKRGTHYRMRSRAISAKFDGSSSSSMLVRSVPATSTATESPKRSR